MSHYQYGTSTVNFGTPTLTAYGIIGTDSTIDLSPNINAFVESESGSVVVQRIDDTVTKWTFKGFTNNGTGSFSLYPGVLGALTSSVFNGPVVCENVSITYNNKSFTQFSATLVNHEYLNYSIQS